MKTFILTLFLLSLWCIRSETIDESLPAVYNRKWWNDLTGANAVLRVYQQWRSKQIHQDWLEWTQCLSDLDHHPLDCVNQLNLMIKKYRKSSVPQDIRENHRYQIESIKLIDQLNSEPLQQNLETLIIQKQAEPHLIELFHLLHDDEYKYQTLRLLGPNLLKPHLNTVLTELEIMISDTNKIQILQLFSEEKRGQNANRILRLLFGMLTDHGKVSGINLLSTKKMWENSVSILKLIETIQEESEQMKALYLLPPRLLDLHADTVVSTMKRMRNEDAIYQSLYLFTQEKKDKLMPQLVEIIVNRMRSDYQKKMAMRHFSRSAIDKHSEQVLWVINSMSDSYSIGQVFKLFSDEKLLELAKRLPDPHPQLFNLIYHKAQRMHDTEIRRRHIALLPTRLSLQLRLPYFIQPRFAF